MTDASTNRHEPAADALEPGLYLVATPIGHLGDVSLRALEILRRADVVACEDTRVTRRLLTRHGIGARVVALHAHNEHRRAEALVERVGNGERVAVVTDAGTPGVADPGLLAVRAARRRGLPVWVVPGPSAVLMALVASGLPPQPFTFFGFVPARAGERRRTLAAWLRTAHTLVLFESPRRLAATLADLAAIAPEREAAVCRELTKRHEEVRAGTLAELAETSRAAPPPRGEITLVIGPAPEAAAAASLPLDEAVREALARHADDPRLALRAAMELSGRSRREAYAALGAARRSARD